MKHSKRYRALLGKFDPKKVYSRAEAGEVIRELASARFVESVEGHVRLGIDPRKTDQNVRASVQLPHGTGKTVRVLAIAKGTKITEAQEAGADVAGGEEIIQRILDGWLDFDAVVATPDVMGAVGSRLGRVLGPRGMMPNPRAGTVGFDVAEMIRALKAGRIEFRSDKTGVIHAPLGKVNFTSAQITENLDAFLQAVEAARPATVKGTYIRSVHIAPTMGPAIEVGL
jgi:large subunit ribosomal protein L1